MKRERERERETRRTKKSGREEKSKVWTRCDEDDVYVLARRDESRRGGSSATRRRGVKISGDAALPTRCVSALCVCVRVCRHCRVCLCVKYRKKSRVAPRGIVCVLQTIGYPTKRSIPAIPRGAARDFFRYFTHTHTHTRKTMFGRDFFVFSLHGGQVPPFICLIHCTTCQTSVPLRIMSRPKRLFFFC
jgi:hypothetical protein